MTNHKHTLWAFLLMAVAACSSVEGQIEVHCKPLHKKYLSFEPIRVELTVINRTGDEIDLTPSERGRGVEFVVQESPGSKMFRSDRPSLESPAIVAPLKTETVSLAIPQWGDLKKRGGYSVYASMNWGGRSYRSAKQLFEVVSGLEIDRFTAGVTGDGQGQSRVYSLVTELRGGGEHLFARIEDEEEGYCYGVHDLGRVIRYYKPSFMLDALGQVHVLHQSGPTHFAHNVFQEEGENVLQEFYRSTQPGAELFMDETGRVVVKGAEPLNEEFEGNEEGWDEEW